MNKVFKKPWVIILALLFSAILIVSRIYNLDRTARFLWDESSDLVNIHEIYVDKKLTLIGPVSEDGSKVFGSLTYYMFLPFAIIGNFDPVSTAYGAAFWGISTGLLILYLIKKINNKLLLPVALIIILWYPLVETGRWAWNPNLIPFFTVLSLIFLMGDKKIFYFFSGLIIGLTLHLHYIAAFAAAGLTFFVLIGSIQKKKFSNLVFFIAGEILTILPFIIFDLTHPPGLFLSRILYFNNMDGNNIFANFWNVSKASFVYFTQSNVLAILLELATVFLVAIDFKNKSKNIWAISIFIIQAAGLAFVANFYTHYILPGLVFFLIYLILPRKKIGTVVSYFALGIILLSGLISFPKQITKVTWESDIQSTRFISDTIISEIKTKDLKNSNIAVLGSPDTNTYGRRYRDLLLIKGVSLMTKGEYEISDHLFVVSQEPIDKLEKDPAYEMNNFRNGKLVGEWNVPESFWKIYLLSR